MLRDRSAAPCMAAVVLLAVWSAPGRGGETAVSVAAQASADDVATELDRRLADEALGPKRLAAGQTLAPRTGDEAFLRRVYLDLVGAPPTPGEVTAFVLDPSTEKRRAKIAALLDDPRFGLNAARYWRDVILARQVMAEQAQLILQPLETFLTEQFNRNVGWDRIARAFVEAKGVVADHGETALFVAQRAEPVDVAAETSRIFLGIQIQCAQCHDHPTDRWKRRQFHEFAAFFPRVALRRAMTAERPTLELSSADTAQLYRRPGMFGQGAREHFMPDLKDPAAQGDMMAPVFFAVDKQMATGTTDEERRHALAVWMTGRDNPWFAKALVNRLWSELVGEGFCEPVDDLGPDRPCSAPRTFDYLAEQFATHDYDLKWLYRTIMATEAYRRESRPKRRPDQAPFAANVPRRLRYDQLIDVLSQALGYDLAGGPQPAEGRTPGGLGGARLQFAQVFGFDPSLRREEIADSIPQALVLMNSPIVNRAVTARYSGSALSSILAGAPDDEQATIELYLQTLSREPNAQEMKACSDYVQEIGDRYEAFEDLYWALLNSEEIRYRN